MALEGILEKITGNADEMAAAIKEEGRLKRRDIISRAESQAEEIRDRIATQAKEKAELERRRATVSAELGHRREILSEKQGILESCFRSALDELLDLPAGEYRALIRKMLLRLVDTGEERVLISPHDEKRIDQRLIDGVNDELKKAGKEGRLKLDDTSPAIRGGFVLRTEHLEVDCSFGVILDQLKEDLQAQIAAILFGDNE